MPLTTDNNLRHEREICGGEGEKKKEGGEEKKEEEGEG